MENILEIRKNIGKFSIRDKLMHISLFSKQKKQKFLIKLIKIKGTPVTTEARSTSYNFRSLLLLFVLPKRSTQTTAL